MIKVGIVGGTGYTGVELLRLLTHHPQVNLRVITSRSEIGLSVTHIFPSLRGYLDGLHFTSPDSEALAACDIVFFATPHGVAMNEVAALLAKGVKIIDLSADFRLKDAEIFKDWYGIRHTCPELLQEAVYGLVEINREQIVKARLIAVPGCYPTAVQLGFAPLLHMVKEGLQLINLKHLIADVKSGVSGAGRKAEMHTLFAESADNLKAYSVQGHRHHPEIIQGLETMAGELELDLTFVPHLIPMIRGIHATLYASISLDFQDYDFQSLFENFYKDERFIDVLPFGHIPETRSVRASNHVRIAVYRPRNRETLVVLVVEDNLVKGASGQAVQCMNLVFGLPEETGLKQIAISP